MRERPKWVMPAWMEPYRELFANTGGNSIEDMMDDQSPYQINGPRALIAWGVKSQVSLLTQLRKNGLLR